MLKYFLNLTSYKYTTRELQVSTLLQPQLVRKRTTELDKCI